jgi:very-short-patch-repair endonuclease
MPRGLPFSSQELLDLQCGVMSRCQALAYGLTDQAVSRRLNTGSWQQLQSGVYATFTGEPSRTAVLWAAVLRSGPGAALSHQSAAELCRLTDKPSSIVHVTVPTGRRVRGAAGIMVHRSNRMAAARHPTLLPPRTRVEETVLDLTQTSGTFDEAFRWLCQACGGRVTTADRLREALGQRKKLRYRGEILTALTAVGEGVHSNLEYRYVRGVERAHRLPVACRQARLILGGRRYYLDNLYRDFGVAVELDGHAAHRIQDRWRDVHRDNTLTSAGIITLRYNWADVTERTCQVTAEVATVLGDRGWKGAPRPCQPGCGIP